jgi:hypothetical protein
LASVVFSGEGGILQLEMRLFSIRRLRAFRDADCFAFLNQKIPSAASACAARFVLNWALPRPPKSIG